SGLIKQKQLPIPPETKIRNAALDQNLADEASAGVPDIDAVAAAAVDVAEDVAFDAVWDPVVGHGEDAAVGEEGAG
ncbi:MAG: hypothetical protein M1835_003996, partial [Candelina submexicana]